MSELNIGKLITEPQRRDAIHVAVMPATSMAILKPGERVGLIDDGTRSPGSPRTVGTSAKEKIGIVDPFLTSPVAPGKQFWVFLMPNTVTSLRHQWVHPAIPAEGDFADEDAGAPAFEIPPGAVQLAKSMMLAMTFDGTPDLASMLQNTGYTDVEVLTKLRVQPLDDTESFRLVLPFVGAAAEQKNFAQVWIGDLAEKIDQTYTSIMEAADLWIDAADYTYDNSESYKTPYAYKRWPAFWVMYELLTGRKPKEPNDDFFTCSC